MNPARFFTIVSLAFGVALILLTPPFCTPDEPAHLYRAWSTANIHFVIHGGDSVPRSIRESASTMLRMTRGAETGQVTWTRLAALARTPLRPNDTGFIPVVRDPAHEPLAYTAPSYTPIGYLATAPAIALGRAVGLSPILLVYLGRLANLLAATAIIAWAITIAPFGRWTIALIALTPMAVFMRGAMAIDALTFAFAIALVAAMLSARPAASILLTFAVCATKPGYAFMPLLSLAIPKLRARRFTIVAIFAAILAGTLLTAMSARSADTSFALNASSRAASVFHHPLAYANDLAAELKRDAKLLVVETVADFGWLDAPAPYAFALFWICGLTAVALIDGRATLTATARVWSMSLFIIEAAVLMTLFHVGTYGNDFLLGLQGRYFLPLLPLGLLPLTATALTESAKARIAYLMTGIAIVQSLWILTTRYWI